MTIHYTPRGVCSRRMDITVENGVVQDVVIVGGCHGNSQGISALVRGMKVSEVIDKLSGIRCGSKASSCPAQLALALQSVTDNAAD